MKVNEVVIAAAELLGDEAATNVKQYVEDNTGDGEILAQELLRCFNVVEGDLARNSLPLKTEEELETETGAIPYEALSKRAFHIMRVTDEWGVPIRFVLYDNYFKARVGRVRVTYTYLPEEKALDGEVEVHRLTSKRLFAYGMAAEYCLKAGLYDEAEVWDKKYKAAISSAYKHSTCRRLRSRVWR